jgi:hypothetical protein
MTRLEAFDAYLKANSIPIDGLSLSAEPAGPTTVTIQFQPSATTEQRAWAAQAMELFDWRPRRFLSDAVIASAYAGLTSQQRGAILNRFVGLLCRQNQAAVVAMFSDLGVSLPVDEVDPDPS